MSRRRRAVLAVAGALAALPLAAAELTPAQQKDLLPRPAEMAPLAAGNLLLAVAAAGDRIVAVGDRGTIVVSGDGERWEQVPVPTQATLTAVSFADAGTGWAVGHDAAILKTTDGGRSWALQHFTPEEGKPLLGVLALDGRRVHAVGAYGLFLATEDGGATWTQLDAPEILEEALHLNALIRLGNGELFMVGETGLLGASADGRQWTRLTIPYEGSLFGALPRGDKGALVYGLRGNVLVSDDVRSNQWTAVDTRTVQSMFGGARRADGTAALVGADGEILLVAPDGAVRRARAPGDERSLGSGTLSGVLPHRGELLVVGESGVGRVRIEAP